MENKKFKQFPSHLTEGEYKAILDYIEKANDQEISDFLDVIKVKFKGGNKEIDKEQVIFAVYSDTNIPEIKEKMLEFINSK